MVSYGYLSVLLTYLCIDKVLKKHINAQLHQDGGTLENLLASAENFLQYHRQVDNTLHQPDATDEHGDHFVVRSQMVIDGLRAKR